MDGSLKESERLLYSLRDMYRRYGYRSFRMSKFEKYELYAGNKDFLVSDRVITFTDTNGDLLALKPDVTLSIIRNAEFRPGCKQKLCYQENVYRPAGSSRQFREIMQCGLECIGDLDTYDLYEVLSLAAESLGAISEKSILSVSHLGILKNLCCALKADEQRQRELLRLVAGRSTCELEALFQDQGWSTKLLDDLMSLLQMSCSLRELPEQLKAMDLTWLDGSILKELEELACLIGEGSDQMVFDLSVINDIHYYNGIVFQGFVQGIAEKVLSGGRYDSLLQRLGRRGGAVGFAIYFGMLEQFLSSAELYDADVLLLYDEETPLKTVRDVLAQLQSSGLSVSAQRSEMSGRYREIRDIRGGAEYA